MVSDTKIDCTMFDTITLKEWLSLNIATLGSIGIFEFSVNLDIFSTIVTAIGVFALAFFNFMRGLKIWQEYKKNIRKNKDDKN
jgi:hypothetical protein